MPDKCRHCGKDISKFPIKAEDGTIIWKNLFKMDSVSIVFLICILVMAYGYATDIASCKDVREDPYSFCGDYCQNVWMKNLSNQNIMPIAKDTLDITYIP